MLRYHLSCPWLNAFTSITTLSSQSQPEYIKYNAQSSFDLFSSDTQTFGCILGSELPASVWTAPDQVAWKCHTNLMSYSDEQQWTEIHFSSSRIGPSQSEHLNVVVVVAPGVGWPGEALAERNLEQRHPRISWVHQEQDKAMSGCSNLNLLDPPSQSAFFS